VADLVNKALVTSERFLGNKKRITTTRVRDCTQLVYSMQHGIV